MERKNERYQLVLQVKSERMEFDRARALARMELEREMIDLEKNEKWIKLEFEKTKTYETLQLEKERLRLSNESRIRLQALASSMIKTIFDSRSKRR